MEQINFKIIWNSILDTSKKVFIKYPEYIIRNIIHVCWFTQKQYPIFFVFSTRRRCFEPRPTRIPFRFSPYCPVLSFLTHRPWNCFGTISGFAIFLSPLVSSPTGPMIFTHEFLRILY